jgi:hypothetical protein
MDAKILQFIIPNGHKVEVTLPSRQAVSELARGSESGRPSGQHLEMGEAIRGNLQDTARIHQLMHLVQNQVRLRKAAKKSLRILQSHLRRREVTVDELNLLKGLG